MAAKRRKKSTYGEGSVYQDKTSGRWIAQVYDGHGKLIRRRAASREAAKTLQEELNRKKSGQINIPAGRQTIETWSNTWYATIKVPAGLKPKTLQHYREMIEFYIIPQLGRIPLEELRAENVQDFVNRLRTAGLSDQTVRHAYNILIQILDVAVSYKYIEYNAAKSIERPKVRKKEPEIFTLAQARDFLAFVDQHRFRALYHLAIILGLRRGELMGLQWRDISYKDSTLKVTQ